MAGFFRNAGDFLGNAGKAYADTYLGAVGLDNVIKDDMYKGYGADQFQQIGDIGGQVGKAALPVALSTAGVPPQATMAAQGVIGGFNPEAQGSQQPVAPQQPYYNGTNTLPQQTYAQSYAYGGYVRGRLKGYAEGDFVGPYAPDYNPQQQGPYSSEYLSQQQTGPWANGYGSYSQNSNYQQQPAVAPAANPQAGASGLNPYIAAGTLALGAYQTYQANKGLKKLQNEAMPTQSASPYLTAAYNRAQQSSQRGYTPEQETAFKTNLSQNQNTAYRNAISQSGGNLAQAINAGLQSQNINALNQFATDDASKKQANIQYADSFAPQFQNIQDENTRNALNYRLMREKALGGAMAQGTQNLATGINATTSALGYM